eukprot:3950059-Ditylum_brightwellii.AAC.2
MSCAINGDGVQIQIIGDIVENGGNYRGAADVLNCWRKRHGKEAIAHSTVRNHVDNFIKTQKQKVEKCNLVVQICTHHGVMLPLGGISSLL